MFIYSFQSQDPAHVAEDEATLRLVQETLENLPLFYCLSRDISRSFYSKHSPASPAPEAAAALAAPASASAAATLAPPAAASAAAASLWRCVDPAYTWNFHMCRPLLEAGDRFCLCFHSSKLKPETSNINHRTSKLAL